MLKLHYCDKSATESYCNYLIFNGGRFQTNNFLETQRDKKSVSNFAHGLFIT